MDWLDRLNAVLDYVEDHLTEPVDFEEMAKISLCPGNLFQRMFSQLTGISVSEYIRKRRLSAAGMDLAEGSVKVIDVAVKYGYESADAFGHAFRTFHGVRPSEAKCPGTVLIHCPRLSFTLQVKGETEMKYRLVEKPVFTVLGKPCRTTQEENMKNQTIPKFWGQCNQDGTVAGLCKAEPDRPLLGVCYGDNPDGSFSYMVGVESNKSLQGYESLTIPAANWAVFESVGPMPEAIHKVWKSIFQEFLPASKYEHAPMPDFELYPEEDGNRPDYRCEVWIPVIPKR